MGIHEHLIALGYKYMDHHNLLRIMQDAVECIPKMCIKCIFLSAHNYHDHWSVGGLNDHRNGSSTPGRDWPATHEKALFVEDQISAK